MLRSTPVPIWVRPRSFFAQCQAWRQHRAHRPIRCPGGSAPSARDSADARNARPLAAPRDRLAQCREHEREDPRRTEEARRGPPRAAHRAVALRAPPGSETRRCGIEVRGSDRPGGRESPLSGLREGNEAASAASFVWIKNVTLGHRLPGREQARRLRDCVRLAGKQGLGARVSDYPSITWMECCRCALPQRSKLTPRRAVGAFLPVSAL